MQFGAFSYAYSTNLGDEIQTLAAAQFLPKIDAHMLPLWATSGTYRTQFCDYFGNCDMANRGTWGELDGNYDPIKIARYGNYYQSTW